MLPLPIYAVLRIGSGSSSPFSAAWFYSFIGVIVLYYGIWMFAFPSKFINKQERELAWLESMELTSLSNSKRQTRMIQIRHYLSRPNLINRTKTNGRNLLIGFVLFESIIWIATHYGLFGKVA